jgi:hypothetical protein
VLIKSNGLLGLLGTGKLRYTKKAEEGDIAAITRVGESEYELRLFRKGSREFNSLLPYTIHFIGHRGKRYGYVPNTEFADLISRRAVGAIV